MRFSILTLGAAIAGISCVSTCSAQLMIESSSGPAHKVQTVSQQSGEITAFEEQGILATDASSNSVNLGDRNDRSVLVPEPEQTILRTSEADSVLVDEANPSGTHVSTRRPIAITDAQMAMLANVPECGMVPVQWPEAPGSCPTPNPIAQYMYQNWCTQGLWDSYPCQRSQQCQHIQNKLHGHNRYASPGCGHAACSAAACGAAGCNSAGAGCAACESNAVGSGCASGHCAQVRQPGTAQLASNPQQRPQAALATVVTPQAPLIPGLIEDTSWPKDQPLPAAYNRLPDNVPSIPAASAAQPQAYQIPADSSLPLPTIPLPTNTASLPTAPLH